MIGSRGDLTEAQASAAVAAIMEGDAPESLVGAFLATLRLKGETAEELTGAVGAIRARMVGAEPFVGLTATLDTCGTGGDGANTLNISTASAVVVAACGVPVAKHGNRSASGNSGSSEVLAELGVDIEAPLDTLRRCLDDLGITFLYAPRFHPGLRHAAPIRRLLPFRTIFNMIGPLANPAGPAYQLIGVPDPRQADLMAHAIARIGVTRAAVVTGHGGLDEVSLNGPTRVLWVEAGTVEARSWRPGEFGLAKVSADELRVSGPIESASRIRALLNGQAGPDRDIVLANASASLLVAGRTGSLAEGVVLAAEAIDQGRAATLLDRWAEMSRGDQLAGDSAIQSSS